MSPLLIMILALVAGAWCGDSAETTAASYINVPFTDEELNAMFLCAGNGLNFNGYKTCQIGCRTACLQPGCGGYKECEQLPNRLHKYKCHCNKGIFSRDEE